VNQFVFKVTEFIINIIVYRMVSLAKLSTKTWMVEKSCLMILRIWVADIVGYFAGVKFGVFSMIS